MIVVPLLLHHKYASGQVLRFEMRRCRVQAPRHDTSRCADARVPSSLKKRNPGLRRLAETDEENTERAVTAFASMDSDGERSYLVIGATARST